MSAWIEHQPQIVVVFLALGLLTALANHFFVRRFDQFEPSRVLPRVSILVPARNEADNIEACLRSLLEQDYPDFEVLVLDDHSTDGTRSILLRLARTFDRLRVLAGQPLPEGWLGKHWACHQLAQAASGELLLFTDADTRHVSRMLRDSVSALLAEDADLVTAFPREDVFTWGEKLIIPVIGFGIFSFLPIFLAQRLRRAALSVTIGQFMLFRRSAFEAVGGYASVRDHIVDDVMLGRRIIQHGLVWRLMDGTQHVSCRMYRGFWDAVDGFTKNIFAFFDYRLSLFVIVWLWMATVFLLPPLVVLSYRFHVPPASYPYTLAALATIESLLLWGIAYLRFRFPPVLVFLYPVSFLLFLLIAFRSLVYTLLGQSSWKGRALAPPVWRW
ncbi:MAG: hydroxychlorobactene glucosyltransferase CruC [Anaerolineales bacterium]